MDELIEKYAMQCTSWPYWRDLPSDTNPPSPMITEWPSYITEDQKIFWRLFVTNMINDLKNDLMIVESDKVDQILALLNSSK
jgi:hypothetical protein